MKWFNDLKTRTKLALAFGLMGALIMLVAYLGVSGMNEINNMLNTLYERDMVGLSHARAAEGLIAKAGRATRQTALDTEPEMIAADVRDYQRVKAEFWAHTEESAKLVYTAEGKAKMTEIRAAAQDYFRLCDEIMDLGARNENAKAAAQIHKARPVAERVDKLLNELSETKDKLGKQAFDESDVVYFHDRKMALGAVVLALALAMILLLAVSRAIASPLAKAAEVLEKVAGGDFTHHLGIDTEDEVGQLGRALDAAVESMRRALDEVRSVAGALASASEQLSASSTDIASGAQEQAASLEETAASLEEITSTVRQNADNAQHAAQLASGSRDVAEKGGRVVDSAVSAMGEITTASKKIADIITAIDEIAFQTNLLALNAAVEAARAGEQGRGFAVVAGEVRNLAQRSATAAKESKALIVDSVSKIESGSKHVTESGDTLQEIVTSVKRVTDMVSEIAAASREQNTGIEQVNKAVSQMDQVTQSNAAQTEEMSATAESLSRQASQLQALVRRFKLEADDGAYKAPVAAAAPAPKRSAPRLRAKPLAEVHKLPVRQAPPPLDPTGTDGFEEL